MNNKLPCWILLSLITFSLIVRFNQTSMAQFSLPSSNSSNLETQNSPWWDLNRSFPCGRNWCSEVHLFGYGKSSGELIVARETEINSQNINRIEVESRAKLIQKNFQEQLKAIIDSQSLSTFKIYKDWRFWSIFNVDKPLHPLTPQVEVGSKNQQTVVFLPAQPQLGISQEDIVTVTEIDAKANVKSVEELASVWRKTIEISFSNALWGRSFNADYPGIRIFLVIIIIIFALFLIWLIQLLSNFLNAGRRKLKTLQKKIIELLILMVKFP